MNKAPVIISAPSGAGKSTIISAIVPENPDYVFSISTTTRMPRQAEKEGVHYYFISSDTFLEKIHRGDFIEWAEVHGNYYGTQKKEIDRIHALKKIPVFDIDVQGAQALRKVLPDAVYIFIIPPSIDELYRRLKDRKTDSEETIRKRVDNARTEIKKYLLFDYIIINDDLPAAIRSITAILRAEQCKVDRLREKIENYLEDIHDTTP